MSLLLLFQGQGTAPTLVDVADIINGLVPGFNAASLETLSVVTEDEMYEFADEAAQRLARKIGMFVERDATLTITGADPTVATPAGHLSTIQASWDSDGAGAWQPLVSSAVNELEALDASWESRAGDPERWTQDQEGTETIRVYKVPAADTGLALIYHELHDTISSAATTFNVPTPIGDYLTYSIIGEVRGQENDEAMPEVAEYARGRAKAYEDIFEQYWGRAQ
jgi:hypothetical protein